ncbi:MAG: serine/threonine protein kinase [Actinobacteria bacterium]|nr:MAG: serine/threonine protein kinase [Actinomycetota bacterium]
MTRNERGLTVDQGAFTVAPKGSGEDAPRIVAPCNRSGCPGEMEDGYCNLCGLAPVSAGRSSAFDGAGPSPSPPGPGQPAQGSRSSGRSVEFRSARSVSTGSGRAGSGNLGAGLVELPSVPPREPTMAILADPEVPEARRFCGSCQGPVGRSWPDKPGRRDGFCPRCGQPYSFRPKLRSGDVVGDQYEVAGCLAYGGLGWIYLARDRNISRWVVLKGFRDSGYVGAAEAAISERRFLAEIEHPNIVKVYNFVQHEGAGYIVMEYVGGMSLQDLRRQHNTETGKPIPVAQAIAFVLEVLPALGYLHGRGLLYCDVKPENIIQTEQHVKLIDLGGVRRMDDDVSPLYGTVGFQAPEVPALGPSVFSDLHMVARTLAILTLDLQGFQDPKRYATRLPSAEGVPLFTRYESFHRFLLKATNPDPAMRFRSAEAMGEQLLGVLREVVALDGAPVDPPSSKLFGPEPFASPDEADWRSLPVPIVDVGDARASLPADQSGMASASDPTALGLAPMMPESGLRLAQAHIHAGDLDRAELTLSSIAAGGYTDWPLRWWKGVRALAGGSYQLAVEQFDAVCTDLSGELPPKLALAYALELAGDVQKASGYYATVTMVDPGSANGSFGLARCRLHLRDRTGAAAALQAIPTTSSAHEKAQVMLCRVLSEVADGWVPTLQDLVLASEAIEQIPDDAEIRTRLTGDLLTSVLAMLREGTLSPNRTEPVTILPLTKE